MPRSPAAPGTVPNARVEITDEALDELIGHADKVMGNRLTKGELIFLMAATAPLLRELRQHRRTQALPGISFPHAANINGAIPLRVS